MWRWPLDAPPLLPDGPGQFGAIRRHDIHTGVDLYCEVGTRVLAVENGQVVAIEWFTGPQSSPPTPWWHATQAVLVEGPSGVVVYGEVSPCVRVGQQVQAGDRIATVAHAVLRQFKGRPMVMLHLEWLAAGSRATPVWPLETSLPEGVMDPTPALWNAVPAHPAIFSMRTYDALKFREAAMSDLRCFHCDATFPRHEGARWTCVDPKTNPHLGDVRLDSDASIQLAICNACVANGHDRMRVIRRDLRVFDVDGGSVADALASQADAERFKLMESLGNGDAE